MDLQILQNLFLWLLLSWVLGWLIGIDKDIGKWAKVWLRKKSTDYHFGSIRSFALISIFWALMTQIDALFSAGYVFVLVWLILTFVLVAIHYTHSVFKNTEISPATEIIAILTYFIGVLVFSGLTQFAIILAILFTFIVSSKDMFEWVSKYISKDELRTTLKFWAIAFVILPLLPNQRFSLVDIFSFFTAGNVEMSHPLVTFDFFNPYSIWFFVVVMSGVSYLGYILSKFVGKNSSIILSSILWGMVSSTATTASMTTKSKEDPGNMNSYVIGTLLASCIMFLRVFAIVFFFSAALFQAILIPWGAMFIAFMIATGYFYIRSRSDKSKKKISTETGVRSPFRVLPALQFAGLIVLIKFVSGVGIIYKDIWGENLFYSALGIVSGLADVDAVTQTMSVDSERWLISFTVAASTVLLAVMSNNLVKGSIAWRLWEKSFWKRVMGSFVFSIVTWLIVIWLVNFL